MNKRSGAQGSNFDERKSVRQANLNRNLNKEDSTSLPFSNDATLTVLEMFWAAVFGALI